MSFVHLRLHTEFSLVDSTLRIKKMMPEVEAGGMPAVAMTDQNNLFAMVKFYRAAMGQGLKPIFGVDVLLQDEGDETLLYHMILLCQNNEGYLNVSKLISRAYQEGQVLGVPRVQRGWVKELSGGIIALSGGREGDVGYSILAGNDEEASRRLEEWKIVFPDRYYLELQRTERAGDERHLQAAVELAVKHEIPVVATNDVRFLSEDDFASHEARVCIHDGFTLADNRREKKYSSQQYLKSAEEMKALFADIPSAIENTVEIAKRCTVELTLGKNYLPQFPIPDGMTEAEYFAQLSVEGMEERFPSMFDVNSAEFAEIRKPYDERLQIELDVINGMGFPGYFLIVADFIQWGKDNDVPVGPGRGSGAGSLVAFALKITDIDPLKYDLLFERFLNPDRVSMPDIDIDFADTGREEIIEYVKRKYGEEAVSQIITFSTLSSRAVLKDVGRVLGIPHGTINEITKDIQVKFGRVQKLAEAVRNPELKWLGESNDPKLPKLIEYSLVLEGFCRAASPHAAGVVIAPGPLEDYIPLYKTPTTGLASQYTMKYLEDAGLLKMDFLGLRTLSIIDDALDLIELRHDVKIDIDNVDVGDETTYELIGRGLTTAIFQFESPPMQKYLKQLKPERLDDLIAMNALYRPGPMDNIPEFIDRKQGRAEITYLHETLEPILGPTYGICVYQEQIMQIAQQIGGFTLAQADNLRRAMGKKQIALMQEMKAPYFEGCKTKGIDRETADDIWDMMVKFADYGFNKSHSAAYAFVAYQTAFLKANYPAEFLAANMTHESSDQTKVVKLIDECKGFGLSVLPPDINSSRVQFSVDESGRIVFGMAAIRNVGQSAVEAILEERQQNGPFSSVFDFTRRLGAHQLVNKRLLEHLILAGAFDSLHDNRRRCFESLEAAIGYGHAWAEQRSSGMDSLFAAGGAEAEEAMIPEPAMEEVQDWVPLEKLNRERSVLDFYVSGHPLDPHTLEAETFSDLNFGNLPEEIDTTRPVKVCGIVTSIRTKLDRRENQFAIVGIEDFTGKAECIFWSEAWRRNASLVTEGSILFVSGRPEVEGADRLRIVADEVVPIDKAIEKFARGLSINIPLDRVDPSAAEATAKLFDNHAGGVQCIFRLYDHEGSLCGKYVARGRTVTPSRDLVDELALIYDPDNIRLS